MPRCHDGLRFTIQNPLQAIRPESPAATLDKNPFRHSPDTVSPWILPNRLQMLTDGFCRVGRYTLAAIPFKRTYGLPCPSGNNLSPDVRISTT